MESSNDASRVVSPRARRCIVIADMADSRGHVRFVIALFSSPASVTSLAEERALAKLLARAVVES